MMLPGLGLISDKLVHEAGFWGVISGLNDNLALDSRRTPGQCAYPPRHDRQSAHLFIAWSKRAAIPNVQV